MGGKKKMKNSKFGVIVIISILLSTFLPLTNAYNISYENTNPPLPGCTTGDFPVLDWNYAKKDRVIKTDILASYNEDIASLIQEINVSMIQGYIENLTAFGPRVTATSACEEAGIYIYNEFLEMGLDVRIHEWTYEEYYGDNIVATIHGVNESSDEIYIICAHYDSVPGSPGADDDGSGTAAVLSAAKAMNKNVFDHTVRFIAFSGEEQGLFGSYFYVEEANESNDNIIAVLNVDMIGFAETEDDANKINVYEDEYSNWITAFTADISEQYQTHIKIEVIPSGYSWGSDHYYFWEAGYNGIFYAEYNFNDYYHSPEDTIENMNIPYAVKCTKLIIATLAELAHFKSEPYKPITPIGFASGIVDTEYNYSCTTSDPQGDQIFYLFDWDDNTDSGWQGPYPSSATVNASHSWKRRGDFNVKVKAKDDNGHESEWSDPLAVTMPKNRAIRIYPLFLQFLENHPHLFPLLRQLLDLKTD